MAAAAPTGLVYDIFRGVPVSVQVLTTGATVAPVMALGTAAAGDQGLPAGLSLASGTGIISGTPTGAASSNFGSNYSSGVTGEGSYTVTIKDTANSTNSQVTFRFHDSLPADETDTGLSSPAALAARENFYNQETGG